MPRPKEVKKRSRWGCHRCKKSRIKCDEGKPACKNCVKIGVECDYSLKLSWGGRPVKKQKISLSNNSPSNATIMFSSLDNFNSPTSLSSPRGSMDFNTFQLNNSDTSSMTDSQFLNSPLPSAGNIQDSGSAFNSDVMSNNDSIEPEDSEKSVTLSNQAVLKSISKINKVFRASPHQQPIRDNSFILEYNKEKPDKHTSQSSINKEDVEPDKHMQNSTVIKEEVDTIAYSNVDPSLDSKLSPSFFSPEQSSLHISDITGTDDLFFSMDVKQNGNQNSHSLSNSSQAPISFESWSAYNNSFANDGENAINRDVSEIGASTSNAIGFDDLGQDQNHANFVLENMLKDSFEGFEGDFEAIAVLEDSLPSTGNAYLSTLMKTPLRRYANGIGSSSSKDPSDASHSSSADDSDDASIINIPRSLSPLPDILLEVPFYRELFYHFIDFSADILVPAPSLYPQNPFKTLLPCMALSTPHLLSLLIAYSATHWSRFLPKPIPMEIISNLLGRTFKGLTASLEDKKEAKSDSTLATAIMLSSYEILNSSLDDSWKTHLHGARDIVMARGMATPTQGGILTKAEDVQNTSSGDMFLLDSSTKEFDSSSILMGPHPPRVFNEVISETDVSYFLLRWFAYIDVIGALSCSRATSLLTNQQEVSHLWSLRDWNLTGNLTFPLPAARSSHDPEKLHNVDFLLGVDLDMIPIFAKISHLARQRWKAKHGELVDPGLESQIYYEAQEMIQLVLSRCEAEEQRSQDLSQAYSFDNPALQTQYNQLCVMSLTFCYGALIHLYRRVFELASESPQVQKIVDKITKLLDDLIPLGSRVESCMSFPIFTAGCEVHDPEVRERYRERLEGMERFGVGQISRARQLMELSWQRNEAWTEIMEENGWELVLA